MQQTYTSIIAGLAGMLSIGHFIAILELFDHHSSVLRPDSASRYQSSCERQYIGGYWHVVFAGQCHFPYFGYTMVVCIMNTKYGLAKA